MIENHSDVNTQDIDRHTPLHALASEKFDDDDSVFEVAKLLLKNGADPTIQDANGRTVLHKAVTYTYSCTMLTDLLFENELS